MILAIDCGNTHIKCGCMSAEQEPSLVFRLPTDRLQTDFGYAATVRQILEMSHISTSELEGAILSSVVPPMTDTLVRAVQLLIGQAPIVVGAGVKTGLHIAVNDPGTVAADLVVSAAAAKALYPLPAVIVDMGTATTVTAVDKNGRFIGGAILPGVKLSLDALAEKTALLPHIELHAPKNAIGSDTVECMKSGILYGNAGAVDALLDRFSDALQNADISFVATGGLASTIIPHCRHTLALDENLSLKGLYLIWEKNKK